MFTVTHRPAPERAGGVLIMVIVCLTMLLGMALAFLTITTSANRETHGAGAELCAHYLAEAAIVEGLAAKRHGGRIRVDGLASLGAPVDFGGVEYELDVLWGLDDPAMGDDLLQMTGTGRSANGAAAIEMLGRLVNGNIWIWGAFGDDALTMDSNAHVDSYDSSLGSYASQKTNGSGSNAWAKDNGSVGSNGDIDLLSNTSVHGSATCGPSATTSLTGKAAVSGSTTPNTELFALPVLTVPSFGSSGKFSYGGSSAVIPPGDHEYGEFTVGGGHKVTIVGPATLVVDRFKLESNSQLWIDASDGPVEIYVANDFIMNSNAILASSTYTPADVSINLNTENISDPTPPVVFFDSNTKLYGTIFAPHARIDFDSNIELFGSVVAKDVHLDSNSRVHFDENLLEGWEDDAGEVEVLWWRTVAVP